jgi:hypothetical protein
LQAKPRFKLIKYEFLPVESAILTDEDIDELLFNAFQVKCMHLFDVKMNNNIKMLQCSPETLTVIIDTALSFKLSVFPPDVQVLMSCRRSKKVDKIQDGTDIVDDLMNDFCRQSVKVGGKRDCTKDFAYLCWQNFLVVNNYGSLYIDKKEFVERFASKVKVEEELDCFLSVKIDIVER